MKYSDLVQYKFHSSSISERDLFVKLGEDDTQEASKPIGRPYQVSQYNDLILDLPTPGNSEGLWIPYKPKGNVYGFLGAGQNWAASGPFSGCYFYVGTYLGRIYVAHVSCEGAAETNITAWNNSVFAKGVVFKKKIGMARNLPLGSIGAGTVVFANISGGAVEVTRVDIRTSSPGSMSGHIFDVTKLDTD